MPDLSKPLSEAELDRIDRFLLDRLNEEREEEPDFDCGIIDVGVLDGFLTAVLSAPQLVPPSAWLPALWGTDEPVWDSMDDFQSVLALMMRHMNSIAATLNASPERFEPLFGERVVEGRTYSIVDDWCHGYMRAVQAGLLGWQSADTAVEKLLEPVRLFGTEAGWKAIDAMAKEEADRVRADIPEAVRRVYVHSRGQSGVEAAPVSRSAPKVGRNDPCPCGSGKKFKKCCLQ